MVFSPFPSVSGGVPMPSLRRGKEIHRVLRGEGQVQVRSRFTRGKVMVTSGEDFVGRHVLSGSIEPMVAVADQVVFSFSQNSIGFGCGRALFLAL